MTLNCPVTQQGHPLSLPNQIFMLHRPDMELELTIQNFGHKKAYGIAYISTFRIIFVCHDPTPEFSSFDIPISNLFKEKVQFPIFGNPYLEGSCYPFEDILPGISHFKLRFKKGGCDTFIRILDRLIKQTRTKLSQSKNIMDSVLYNQLRTGSFNFNAYVDPKDPSKIYSK